MQLRYSCCRYAPAPCAAQNPDTVLADREVRYSAVGGRQTMDIIRPRDTSAAPHPEILLVHGGGFATARRRIPGSCQTAERICRGHCQYRLARAINSRGVGHQAAVRYLAPTPRNSTWTPYIGTLAAAASPGAHAGLTAGVAEFEGRARIAKQSSAVQCVVGMVPPISQSYPIRRCGRGPSQTGGDLKSRAAHPPALQPANGYSNAAPTLAIHGTADPYVAYEQSLWIVERLIAAGVPAELETISGAGHGFKGADALRADERAIAWFDKYLKPAPARHTLLISDHGPNGEIAEIEWPSGKLLWKAPNDHGHDVQSLPNGHVLFTINPQKKVVELDADHKPVWTFSEGLEHPIAAQRLPGGNTLISDARLGKVIEVTPAGTIAWKYESKLASMRSRACHRTAQSTTLIAVEADAS